MKMAILDMNNTVISMNFLVLSIVFSTFESFSKQPKLITIIFLFVDEWKFILIRRVNDEPFPKIFDSYSFQLEHL